MKTLLKKLKQSLKNYNFHKEAQEIDEFDEYAEPWHQEAVEEFGDEIIPEHEESLKDLEDKYTVSSEDLIESLNNIANATQIEIIQNILKKEGFKPMFSNTNIIAGKGSYGLVLRGIYQGKPAVIKIEIGKDNNPPDLEINNWKKILEVKETMPDNLKKHLPNIYKLNSGVIYEDLLNYSYNDVYYTVIIMEELFKLSKDLYNLLEGVEEPGSHNTILNSVLDNPDSILEVSKNIFNNLSFYKTQQEFNVKNIFEKIYNNLENGLSSDVDKYSITKNIINDICKFLNIKVLDDPIIEIIKRTIRVEIYKLLNIFPTDQDNSSLIWEKIPETKSLIGALKYLKQNAGLAWYDQHTGNIMMDRDGNLKIIDVGLWMNV